MRLTLTVNDQRREDEVEPRMLLVHYLREVAGLTGTHVGCETSLCGACTVMTTAIKPDEILTAVSFAPMPPGAGFAYLKHRQPASGFAMVGAAAFLTLDKSGKCQGTHVGMTGLGAKVFRAKAVEDALNGRAPDAKVLADAAAHVADGIDPLSDIHASADFRAELARVYTRRALESAVARARR